MRRALLPLVVVLSAGCHSAAVVRAPQGRHCPEFPDAVDEQLDRALLEAEWPAVQPSSKLAPGETDRVLYVTQGPVTVYGVGSSYSSARCSTRPLRSTTCDNGYYTFTSCNPAYGYPNYGGSYNDRCNTRRTGTTIYVGRPYGQPYGRTGYTRVPGFPPRGR